MRAHVYIYMYMYMYLCSLNCVNHSSVVLFFFFLPPTGLSCFQFLLSQAHRLQALELLGRFLDQGPWAVHLALAVGIFPYVLKLLGSKLRELQPILVFIWAKILAVDPVSARGGGGGAVFCFDRN